MNIRTRNLISKYGQKIQVTKDNKKTYIHTKAFIQPLRCDMQSELYGDYTDSQNVEQYLYIGLSETNLSNSEDAIVIVDNIDYKIKKAEEVIFSGKVLYERAVLEKSTS